MNWIERNSIWIAFGFMAGCIVFQMWYIMEIKSELKLFHTKEHIVIEVIELEGHRYSDTVRIKCDGDKNRIIKKSIDKF
jgi:hypothetical protein